MLNYFYREYWNVAIRKKKEKLLFEGECSKFYIIKNGKDYWLADPFLYEHEGKCYIFAELYDCKKGKGVIAYLRYDADSENGWHVAIEEDYHLSFPFIYEENGNVYIIPESSYGHCLCRYKAVEFPKSWEKEMLLEDVSIVDTAFLINEHHFIGLTTEMIDNHNVARIIRGNADMSGIHLSDSVYSDDDRYNRLGGQFIIQNGEIYAVFQDGKDYYGKALHFIRFDGGSPTICKEDIDNKRTVYAGDIYTDSKRGFIGVHTYNHSENYEVIDLKHMEVNIRHIFFSVIRKVRRMFVS